MKLDLRGLKCPFLLSEISQALSEHPDADLEAVADYVFGIRHTVPAFCQKHGYNLTVDRMDGPLHQIRISRL